MNCDDEMIRRLCTLRPCLAAAERVSLHICTNKQTKPQSSCATALTVHASPVNPLWSTCPTKQYKPCKAKQIRANSTTKPKRAKQRNATQRKASSRALRAVQSLTDLIRILPMRSIPRNPQRTATVAQCHGCCILTNLTVSQNEPYLRSTPTGLTLGTHSGIRWR